MERAFASSEASFKVSDFGAHVLDWVVDGKKWLFLSELSSVNGPKATRGGVPIIFPQFNEFGPGKRHGFARTSIWQFNESLSSQACAVYELSHSEESLADWPFKFLAQFKIELANNNLQLTLSVQNTDDRAFEFTAALHTYLDVDNIYKARILGLSGLQYWDNDGSSFEKRRVFDKEELDFDGAIDRVYFDLQQILTLQTPKGDLSIAQNGFDDSVVWNPGIDGAKELADLADSEYQKMLCIEAAQIDKPIHLTAGESWTGSQVISILNVE